MPYIELKTIINAPLERCFDLSRSIDLHKLSTPGTQEEAVGGVRTGLIGKDQEVTWRAKHFGVTQTLSSRITGFKRPCFFRDEMIEGIFKAIKHDHIFRQHNNMTLMTDKFYFGTPGWLLGKWFNKLILTRYLSSLLRRRNQIIKDVAESEVWRKYLKP